MKVALAISSYNGDMAALDLVRSIYDQGCADLFTSVAVIDSGDTARCSGLQHALQGDFADVEYDWRAGNLGAAGNLRERLRWAGTHGADALMAVNADGRVDENNVRTLLRVMDRTGAVAVYPTAVLSDGRVDLSYRRPVPVLPSRTPLTELPDNAVLTVSWGSSNGALYRLEATEAVDFEVVENLWHGWEDLALGLLFRSEGGLQVMSLEAVQSTSSDQRKLRGRGPVVSDKPPWTTYYSIRNLLLIRRAHPRLSHRVALRVAREFAVVLLRDQKMQRYRHALIGLADGLRGVTGQRVAGGS